jgi:branched-chain amino acid transport system substrate-binding protein
MERSLLLSVAVVVAVALVCLTLPERASARFTGEVRVGGLIDLTGAFGIQGKEYAEGILDYVRYVNEKKGGIKRQKWDVLVTDYQYEIPQAIAAYKKFVFEDGVVAMLGWGTGDTEAMAPMITKDKIPYLSASYSAHLIDATKFPYNFIGATSYSTQARVACQFIKLDWKKWSERPPRVCFMYSETGFGRSPIADGKAEAARLGIKVVSDEIVDLQATDATRQLRQVQQDGADYIILQANINSSAVVTKELRALGLNTKLICLNWAIDEIWLEWVGEAGEGVFGCIPYALWSDTDLPGVRLMHEVSKTYHPQVKQRNSRYVQGFSAAMLMEEALKLAGVNPTGKKIKEAFETFRNFTTGGILPPVTYTATSHEPCNSLRIYQVKKGKLVPITNYIAVSR